MSSFLGRWLLLLALLLTRPLLAQPLTTRTFSYSGIIETFIVPAGVTSLTIEARGAEGGAFGPLGPPAPGKGAIITGTVPVTAGQQLKILVGQRPLVDTQEGAPRGGGGGSFVTDNSNNPLVIAGGGGGSGLYHDNPTAKQGQEGGAGGDGSGPNAGKGGVDGNGGVGKAPPFGLVSGSGGGLRTDGTGNPDIYGNPRDDGQAFVNGGAGGNNGRLSGGFGGGGAGGGSGGGGGGYSGGGHGGRDASGVGGGGGSFNADPNGTNIAGENTGNGQITITYIIPPCPPSTYTTGTTPQGQRTIQVSGGTKYERIFPPQVVDGVTYQFGETNTTGTFVIPAGESFRIVITGANGCQTPVTGQ